MAEPSNCGGVAPHRISGCLGHAQALRRFKSGRHASVVAQSGSAPPGSVVIHTTPGEEGWIGVHLVERKGLRDLALPKMRARVGS